MACLGRADQVSARRYLEEALALAEEQRDTRQVAAALNALAQFHRLEGSLGRAEPLYQKVIELARALGDRESIAIGLLNLAMVSIGGGTGNGVGEMLVEVLTIAEEIGSKPAGQSVLEVSAGLAALRGDWEQAARFYGVAEAQAGKTGLRRDPADEAFLAPLVATTREALGTAAFSTAEVSGRVLPYADAMAQARRWLEGVGDDR
jgi:tetratricopeptide (TPR) repeat protein